MMVKYSYTVAGGADGLRRISGAPGAGEDDELMLRLPARLAPDEIYTATELMKSAYSLPALELSLRLDHETVLESGIPVLCAYPDGAGGARLPLILFAHGFENSKEKVLKYGIRFAERGFFTVMMDAPMHGERRNSRLFRERYGRQESRGAAWSNRLILMKEYLSEILAILDFFRADGRIDADRTGVAGISMGGTIALLAASRDSRIGSVVSFVPVLDFENVPELRDLRRDYPVELDESREYDPIYLFDRAPASGICVLCGEEDEVVGSKGARKLDGILARLYSERPSAYLFREYPGTGHAVSAQMADDAIEWLRSQPVRL
jgi:dienelactone hydrolase